MKYAEELSQTLTPEMWEKANRLLTAKMLQEFMYEDMIEPEPAAVEGDYTVYSLELDEGIVYTFHAKKRLFDSYSVNAESVMKQENGRQAPLNAKSFLLELQSLLNMESTTVGHLIKEYEQTLLADCHLMKKDTTAEELTHLDYAELEGEMSGHPWITYNKGRLGFNYEDYLRYAPEKKQAVTLYWIAVHEDIAEGHHLQTIDFSFLKEEMGSSLWKRANDKLKQEAREGQEQFYYLPVHPWQWENVIIQRFAEELAQKKIIPLGEGNDQYLPQQSIRTFVNQTHRSKYHVKLPMSILNTLVYRGLPGERTVIAPRVTSFIKGIWENDEYLKDTCKLDLLGEEASVHVYHPAYDNVVGVPYQYKEMLGAIWRESVYNVLEVNEKPVTLAALLHEDWNGDTLVEHWIKQSGLTANEWIKQLNAAILPPLLHYLYQYGTVFSPHGQNTIIVLENGKPKRLIMKDFVDDVNISDQPLQELQQLEPELKEVLRSEPPEGLTQFIFTGLFICHYRYLADLLDRKGLLNENEFWKAVRQQIINYQHQFPHLQKRFDIFDLFKPRMTKLCLNRNRMMAEGYSDSDDRPHASEYGLVPNALAESRSENPV
ncbi:IucA/IucC family protein [Alteribacillus bidgolensis]|uniref:Siderophore synthetase component n=1 Tax=Alteribacillus bidgolensis TaxID=930129 RepID=A0A1G8II56_9BACI|nr:IucA/IucC family siderophore biosynthesis protein [Alteribacillus bidgolensis]SDI18689.1 Siderophore synthetase component [Alteribacillus bidgolensis]